jgi:hypothetical protein
MPVLFPWAPPLPFVNEFVSLCAFTLDNLDDCCEDALKLILLASVAASVRHAAAAAGPYLGLDAAGTRRLGVSMAVAAAGATYPSVDQLADSFAHHAQAMQESLRSTAGLPPSTPDAADLGLAEEQGAVVGMIDDVVEDAFKSVCVFSHYTMGALLGGTMRRVLASWLAGVDGSSIGARCAPTAGHLASTLVIVGTPAGRYYKCDEYGDRLGDLVQQTMLDWTAAAG